MEFTNETTVVRIMGYSVPLGQLMSDGARWDYTLPLLNFTYLISMANNYPIISVRLHPDDKKALQELAHSKRTTLSELVVKSLKAPIRKGKELL